MVQMRSETGHLVNALPPVADAFDSTVYSDIMSLRQWSRCRFIIQKGVGVTGTSTITVEACSDVSASATTAIGFWSRDNVTGDTPGTLTRRTSAGYVNTAGSNGIVEIEVDAAEVAVTGYGFVRLKAVESVNSPVLAGILWEGYGSRYPRYSGTTAIV